MHFLTYVFTDGSKSVDELLEPYYEGVVPRHIRYTKKEVIEQKRKDWLNFLQSPLYQEYLENPEQYIEENKGNSHHIEFIQSVRDNLTKDDEFVFKEATKYYDDIDADGNVWSEYNDNGQYDYYTKCGEHGCRCESFAQFNKRIAKEIVNELPCPYAYITPDGVWHEAELYSYGSVEYRNEKQRFSKKFTETVSNFDDNVIVNVVDCHD